MARDVIAEAVALARERAARSDRDLTSVVEHYARSLASVCDDWALEPTAVLGGGAGAPVIAARSVDGVAGALKIGEPGELDVAARVMQAAEGRGYARVLRWDPLRGALVTEMLGTALWTESPTLDTQGPIIASLLRDAWRVPLDAGAPFPGKASGLLRILAELGPRYGSRHRRALDQATTYAHELADTERPEIVCHGDPHPGNVLRREGGWALIDPDGFVGERGYDLGVALRDGRHEIVAAHAARPGSGRALLREASARLAWPVGVDAERVWRWAFVERVTTGLYLHWHGYADQGATFLDTATIIAA